MSDTDTIYKGRTKKGDYSKEQEAKRETFWSKVNVAAKVICRRTHSFKYREWGFLFLIAQCGMPRPSHNLD